MVLMCQLLGVGVDVGDQHGWALLLVVLDLSHSQPVIHRHGSGTGDGGGLVISQTLHLMTPCEGHLQS